MTRYEDPIAALAEVIRQVRAEARPSGGGLLSVIGQKYLFTMVRAWCMMAA
jgi:hypothetical protein